MKFKVFTVVLLGLCFLALAVMSGAIPVTVPGRAADRAPAAEAVPAAAVPTAKAMPRITVPPTAGPTPVHTASPAPSSTAAPSEAPEHTTAPTAEPASAPMATATPAYTPAPTAAPTSVPTAGPTAAPTEVPTTTDESSWWEPEAVAVSTTITWVHDPINNVTDHDVDAFALLDRSPDISLPRSGPQILIIHTHGTEAYTPDGADQYEALEPYRTTDEEQNVTRVGRALADALEGYGLDVLVDTELYDYPNYDGAYARSGEAMEDYLTRYPSLAMVIDLHRDAIGDGEVAYGPVSDGAAQMMFVMGSEGTLSYPNWEKNLALAMSLQGLVDEAYPHLMRPTTLCSNRYNQQLTPGSLLLEVGATGNTLQEALAAVDLFAQAVGPALAARVGA